jgi:hypothetical protein
MTARPGEAYDETGLHRIQAGVENDWYVRGRGDRARCCYIGY